MRTNVDHADLAEPIRSAFGDRELVASERLSGGTAKGVYRLRFADGGSCLAYRWHRDENYWPAQTVLAVGPLGATSSRAAFLDRRERLGALGVRVPELFALGGTDLALVEDVRGGSLEDLLARDVAAGREALGRLRDQLHRMHAAAGVRPDDPSPCEEIIAERGRRALAEAAARVPVIAAQKERLGYALSTRLAAVEPRSRWGWIHGELGPDHVLMSSAGEPVMIDIEGAMVFDAEWEHAFLELRFHADYPLLHTVELDPARMALYRLVQYLSLVAGPLLLLDGDFPDREPMRRIAEWNTARVLAEL
ncbi:phosphotransferase [Actinoplanes sp. NBC_00393]|uniref:phosphotransferase n=1 Tax=Actinoplanes sp. NBC_00393 TaxID=2975953 RepID=UPI002E20690E